MNQDNVMVSKVKGGGVFTQVLTLAQSIPNCSDSVDALDSVDRECIRLDVRLVVCLQSNRDDVDASDILRTMWEQPFRRK